jgi:signal transduction histidine kinase
VKAIVERHHGSISLADADPGATQPGLAVAIRLPAWRGHARLAESNEPERASATRSGVS